ncbi:MAG: hypothetical protein E7Z92_06640 [Cyanobacteria bacterium SIG31]|nr:hypothetical protein [Cyanobacteria bacterium SIG31]
MDLNNLNLFGSLTMSNGKKLSIEDALSLGDINKDGKLSTKEIENLFKVNGVDTVTLNGVDKNQDGTISNEEFKAMEDRAAVQEKLNALKSIIAKDFTGEMAKFGNEIVNELVEWTMAWVELYNDDNIVEDFEKALNVKYTELKDAMEAKTPSGLANAAVDELYDKVKEEEKDIRNSVCNKLYNLAINYAKNNPEATLEEIITYLEEALETSEKDLVEKDRVNWEKSIEALGWLSSSDISKVKKLTTELLEAVISKGVILNIDGKNIATAQAIEKLIASYPDVEDLINAVKAALDGLSELNMVDKAKKDKVAAEEQKAKEALDNMNGSDVQVGFADIDLSAIDGYNSGKTVSYDISDGYKGRHTRISDCKQDARNRLNNLKEQFYAAVKADLEKLGIPTDSLDVVFEDVFASTVEQTISQSLTIKDKKWDRDNCFDAASFNVKELVNNFVTNFNTNIAAKIDAITEFKTDLDLQDIDPAQMKAEEYTTSVLSEPLGTKKKRKNWAEGELPAMADTAAKMIDNLKDTMLAKAKAMCEANGIEFNSEAFNEIFVKARTSAVSASVHSVEIDRAWKRDQQQVYIDTTQLFNTFTTNFKEQYTAWVEGQKAKK